MNSIRSKLKHGFGKKRATTSRQTATTSRQAAVKPSIAATVVDDLRTSKRRTKRKTEREAKTSPEIVSLTASDMERLRAKSQYVRGKKKSYKSSKLCTTDSFEEVMSVRNSLFGPSRICDSLHEGSLMLQTKLHIHVDRLFQLLFSNSDFFANFQAKRQTTELQLGQWSNSKNGEKARIVSMTVALNVTVGPKVSKVTEQQKMRQCSTPGELYSIDIVCTQEGIPYADVFNVILHYCLVGHLKNHTELMVYANVNFIKSTWAVIRTFIMKHSFEGLAVYFGDLHKELLNEISNSKG